MGRLTDSQFKAVNLRDKNILVTASAGTGKTHAMIERVVELVMGRHSETIDGNVIQIEDEGKRVPAKRILLMTFTNAAAAEMKARLVDQLIDEFNKVNGMDESCKEKKRYILEQIDSIPMCDISTIHAFCANELNRYFHETGLNPDFDIADEEDEKAYLTEALNRTFEVLSDDCGFIDLRRVFSEKIKDARLEELIVDIHNYAYSMEEPLKWLDEICLSEYSDDFSKTKTCGYLISDIIAKADCLLDEIVELHSTMIAEGQGEYADWLKFAAGRMGYFADINSFEDLIKACKRMPADPVFSPSVKRNFSTKRTNMNKKIAAFYATYNLNKEFLNHEIISGQIKAGREFVCKVIQAVKVFSGIYSEIKQKDNKLTYSDLEQYMVKLIRNDEIAEDIRTRYDYILIDEYQDINYLQEYIITRISDGNNLFMVGDSKQSIYRFRQAVPEIFISKASRYCSTGKGHTLSFNHNFRSRKAILDYVNSIFSKVMTKDFGSIDYLNAAMLVTEPDDDAMYSKVNDYPPVSIITYKSRSRKTLEINKLYSVREDKEEQDFKTNADAESKIIYDEINKLIGTPYYDRKENKLKSINYSDIVIIFRSRSETAKKITRNLIDANLPINASNFIKEENSDEKSLLINLLRILDNLRQDIPLAAVMRSFFGKFTDDELVQIRLSSQDYTMNFHEILPKVKDKAIEAKINSFNAFLSKFRAKASYMSVFDLIREIIVITGYDRYILAHPDGERMYKGLMNFVYSLKDKSYAATVSKFLYHYDNFLKADRKETSESSADSITVSTMHGVKGLEYPVVIVAGSDSPMNHSDKTEYEMDNELGMAFLLYDCEERSKEKSIFYLVMEQRRKFKEKEDNLNLFYVVLTRAKNHLIITGRENKEGLKELFSPTDAVSFLDWAAVGKDFAYYRCIDCEDESKIAEEEIKAFAKEREIAYFSDKGDPLYKEVIKKMLSDDYLYKESTKTGIKYTVSAINKSAYREDIYVPSLFTDDSAAKGTVSHKFMEYIDFKCSTEEELEDELTRLIEEKTVTAEEVTSLDRNEILNCLNSDIIRYASQNKTHREKTFMLKLRADEIMDTPSTDEVLLQGTIDLIIEGRENIIVDYKRTGIENEKKIAEIYRKQLDLYAMAAEKIMGIKIHKKVIYLFGRNKTIEL